MKKPFIYISLLIATFLISSCEENQMDNYKNEPAIYFEHNSQQADSINFSFFSLDNAIKRDTINVRVALMGLPTDHDCPIKLVQTNIGKPDAAVAGVHYIAFDNDEVKRFFCIPAKAVYVDIPIIALRDISLSAQEKRLELAVSANENFKVGIDDWKNFTVVLSDLTTKPKLWDTYWKYYFGVSWGAVKMRFIIQSTGLNQWENRISDYSYLLWLSSTAKQALLDYNLAHPDAPLKEANGDIVSMDK